MGKVKIRYFVERAGAAAPRYFWSPAKALRNHGFLLTRLPDNKRQAIDKANALNEALDAWRKGDAAPPGAPAPLATVQPRTLAAAIRVYERSRFFLDLRDRTKRSYRQNMKFLEVWGGDTLVAAITPATVEKLYTSLYKATPSKAAAIITMLRILLHVAVKQSWVPTNAAVRAGVRGRPPTGRIWPREAVTLFAAAADAEGWHSVGTAVILNHWLGQREGDILTLPHTAIAGGRVTIQQSKTAARISIPDNQVLRDRIAAELASQQALQEGRDAALRKRGATPMPAAPQPTFLLCENTGKPWTEHYFRHVFAQVRATLAAEHPHIPCADGTPAETGRLLFMHLRHTAVTELAIAGCTPPQIRGITGHSITTINTILSRYLVLTSELADAAAAKRTAYDAQRGAK